MTHSTRIFLASSSELAAERAAFEVRINRRNKLWHDDGLFLHLDIWEDYVDAMSLTRLQDEYNRAVVAADIVVVLVHTKVGKYTHEEFDTAHRQFAQSGRAPRIYTYFKNVPEPGASTPGPDYGTVLAFRQHLANLGHFPTPYQHTAELLDHFGQQLDKLRKSGFIHRGTEPAGGTAGAGTAAAAPPITVGIGGAVALGPGSIAAAQRAGVARDVAGSIHTGDQTHIHTGGGAYVGGSVHQGAGSLFVGRDHIVTASREEDRGIAQELLQAVDDMAREPDPGLRDARLARLIEGLADLAPEAATAIGPWVARRAPTAMDGPRVRQALRDLNTRGDT